MEQRLFFVVLLFIFGFYYIPIQILVFIKVMTNHLFQPTYFGRINKNHFGKNIPRKFLCATTTLAVPKTPRCSTAGQLKQIRLQIFGILP